MYFHSLRGRRRKGWGMGRKEKGREIRERGKGLLLPFAFSPISLPLLRRPRRLVLASMINYDIKKTHFPLSKRNMTLKARIKCHEFPCNVITKSLFVFLEKKNAIIFTRVMTLVVKGQLHLSAHSQLKLCTKP